jgi:sulfite reductase (NADPH) flavoprotein alpha-component
MSPDRAVLLTQLVDGLDTAGLHWLSGYAAGLAAQPHPGPRGLHAIAPPTPALAEQRATILYGSQTGNAKRSAEQLQRDLDAAGLPSRLLRADAYPPRELAGERLLYLVFSTQGEGEPSDDARGFFEFLSGRRAPKLPELRYAVLGLGDSTYPQFCVIGQQLDARLADLGARRLQPVAAADLDIDSVEAPWRTQAVMDAREQLAKAAPVASVTPLRAVVVESWSRDRPFAGELLANQRISGRRSDKDVRHLELSLAGSELRYEPGDALGVWPQNPPPLVTAVLDTLALDGDAEIAHGSDSLPLRQWLSERRELTRLARPFIASHAAHARSESLSGLLAPNNSGQLQQLLAQQQVIDLLQQYSGAWSGEDLVAALRPLTPRLYSIASSQKAVGDEVHLTVAHVQYQRGDATRWGAASHWLAGAADGARLPLYIEANERFRLPADPDRNLIMIGPGTGIAPFRGFVQDRVADGARGRHWLLFGATHFHSDFLYQLEWQQALKVGQLHRLDLAFSRDQPQKIYVQQRLREQGRDLFAWLQDGAHLYVCGATAMARDVHATLIDVVAEHGGKSREDAGDYLSQLLQQGRYARDVY